MRDVAQLGESATIEQLHQASGKRTANCSRQRGLIRKRLVYRRKPARIAFTEPMFGRFHESDT